MHPANEKQTKHLPIKHAREPFVPLTLVSLAAPLFWATHFAILFLLEGFLCTRTTLPGALVPGTILVVTLVFGGFCAWSLIAADSWLRRAGAAELQSRAFLVHVQRILAGLALVAIVWSGNGALFLNPCAVLY